MNPFTLAGRSSRIEAGMPLHDDEATGYSHPAYAASLSEFGAPLELPRSGGWLLRRAIPGSDACDAMGPYPLFACRSPAGLAEDLRELDGRRKRPLEAVLK
jgi:hypothetical protein